MLSIQSNNIDCKKGATNIDQSKSGPEQPNQYPNTLEINT